MPEPPVLSDSPDAGPRRGEGALPWPQTSAGALRPAIQVTGGAGDIAADLADLGMIGRTVKGIGADLAALWLSAGTSAANATLDTDSLACPVTAAAAVADMDRLLLGPGSLLATGGSLAGLGAAVLLCEQGYRLQDGLRKEGFVQMMLHGGPATTLGRLRQNTAHEQRGLVWRTLTGQPLIPGDSYGQWDLLPVDAQSATEIASLLGPGPLRFGVTALALGLGPLGVTDSPVRVHPSRAVRDAGPPPASARALLEQTQMPTACGAEAQLRINRVTRPDGSRAWVVVLRGTENFGATRRGTAADLATNLAAMSPADPRMGRAVRHALERQMRQAGADPRTEPIMLVGHSQGGILAARLATDPRFTSAFTVTTVLTAGAPVARMPPPAGVQTLALEHDQDVVAALDGAGNPDRPNLTTVRRDLVTSPRADAAELMRQGRDPLSGLAYGHELSPYLETADSVDRSDDASIRRWRQQAAPFLEATSQESWAVDISREEGDGPGRQACQEPGARSAARSLPPGGAR